MTLPSRTVAANVLDSSLGYVMDIADYLSPRGAGGRCYCLVPGDFRGTRPAGRAKRTQRFAGTDRSEVRLGGHEPGDAALYRPGPLNLARGAQALSGGSSAASELFRHRAPGR